MAKFEDFKMIMEKAEKIEALEKLLQKRATAMSVVAELDEQINAVIGLGSKKIKGKKAGRKAKLAKPAHPKEGSAPEKLCKVMSDKIMSKKQIADKSGLSLSTVTSYLTKFKCFKNVRGKGYIYKK